MRLLSVARDLQRRKGRERRSLFVAEGVRAVEEVVRARVSIRGAIISPQLEESARGRSLLQALEHRAAELLRVEARQLAEVAGTETSQGVIAIVEVPPYTLDDLNPSAQCRILVLDAVQDPGNVGTILRTAAGLGAAAVVALPGTVDLWNPKVVRGGMGAHFRIPALHSEVDELFPFLDRQSVEMWVTDVAGEPIDRVGAPPRLALALGSEGVGVSRTVREHARRHVGLPLTAGVESLNVAVAAGIILYALREQGVSS